MSQRHLTLLERGQIELMLTQGWSKRAIAKVLGRNSAVISRECRRNRLPGKRYCARTAQRLYEQRRKYCVRSQVLEYAPLRRYVFDKLGDCWSPEQISERLKEDYPYDGRMRVSPESIYRKLYTDPRWRNAFGGCLRQGRKRRQKRSLQNKRRAPIANKVSIDQRPAVVDDLSEAGHWEGDTIIGKGHEGAVVTLVERKLDILRAIPVASRKADEVANAVCEALADIPASLRKSITFDNGTEFARHEEIAQTLDVDVYFAHPYCSNERARNENTNGLLRQFLPKGMSFKGLTKQTVSRFVEMLNDRPRRKQHYRTPNEVFNDLCTT